PNDLRAALQNTLAFEQQSESFKLQTLLAMSLSAVQGEYWTNPGKANGSYQPCGGPQWSTRCSSSTIDGAYLAEALRSGFLNNEGYASTVFYENQPAATADSPYDSPVPLSDPNVVAEID